MRKPSLAIIPYSHTGKDQPIDLALKSRQRAFRYASLHSTAPRVTFHDMQPLAASRALSFGESGHDVDGKTSRGPTSNTLADEDFKTLQAHIKTLIDQAASKHKRKPYHVTRLLTPEFSFYTKTPLSAEQLTLLIGWLQSSMAELPSNIHCLLSSFAVAVELSGEPTLLNVACYATSGDEASVNTIIKARPSEFDVDYNGHYTLFNQNRTRPGKISETLCHGVITDDQISIHNNQILTLTVDDTTIDCAVSICFDHNNFSGMAYFSSSYNTKGGNCSSQTAYIVSSNILDLDLSKAPCLAIAQADPVASKLQSSFISGDNALATIDSGFGPTLTLYDTGTRYSAELILPLEEMRRIHVREQLSKKLRYEFSDDDIQFEIKRLTDFEYYDQAIKLLPLLAKPDLNVCLILFKHRPMSLPKYELNLLLLEQHEELNVDLLLPLCDRLNDLEPPALNTIAITLLNSGHPDAVNRLFALADRLSEETFYTALQHPEFISTVNPVALAKIVAETYRDSMHSAHVINLLMQRYSDMPNFCKTIMIAACPLMNADSLDKLCTDLEHMEKHEVRYVFAQFARMSDHARHLMLQQHRQLSSLHLLTITSVINKLPAKDIALLLQEVDRFSVQDIAYCLKHSDKIPPESYGAILERAKRLLPKGDSRLIRIQHTFESGLSHSRSTRCALVQ